MELPNKQAINRTGISVFIILQKCMKWHLDKRGGGGQLWRVCGGRKGASLYWKAKACILWGAHGDCKNQSCCLERLLYSKGESKANGWLVTVWIMFRSKFWVAKWSFAWMAPCLETFAKENKMTLIRDIWPVSAQVKPMEIHSGFLK